MFCNQCGNQLFEGTQFCPECGAKVITNNDAQQTSVPSPTPNVQKQPQKVPSYVAKRNAFSQPAMKVVAISCGICGAVFAILILLSIIGAITSNIRRGGSSGASQEESSGNTTYIADLDKALYGRWRADDGTIIELNSDGTAYTNLSLSPWWVRGGITEFAWEASDGCLYITTVYDVHYTYSITFGDYDSEWLNEKYDKLVFASSQHFGYEYFERLDGTEGDSIIGQWIDSTEWNYPDTTPFYVFNDDGTGSFNRGGVSCIWSADEENFYMTYALMNSFDYYVKGDSLQLFFTDGSKFFTRVSN